MRTLGRLLAYVRPLWPFAAFALASLGAATGLNLLIPILVRDAVDHGITVGDSGRVTLAALAILGVAALRAVFAFGWRFTADQIAQRVTYRIRNELYGHLQALHFAF